MAMLVHVVVTISLCIVPAFAQPNSTTSVSSTDVDNTSTSVELISTTTPMDNNTPTAAVTSTTYNQPEDSVTQSSASTKMPSSLPAHTTTYATSEPPTSGMTDTVSTEPASTSTAAETDTTVATIASELTSTTMMMTSPPTSAMPPGTTSDSATTVGATMSDKPGSSDRISTAVLISVVAVCVLLGLVIIFAIGVWCLKKESHDSAVHMRNDKHLLDQDEMDEAKRMTMHRPESATVNADGEISFMTFGTAGSAKDVSKVGGIENPTYIAMTVLDEADDTTAGEGDNGTATIPSTARLHQNVTQGDAEGALDVHRRQSDDTATATKNRKSSKVRPESGVSYGSADIDDALETIDIGLV